MSTTEPQVARAAAKAVDATASALKEAVNATKTESAPAPAKKTGKPKTYVSSTATYVGGVLVRAGEPFATEDPKGADWTETTPKEAAAIEAATEKVPDDAQFDAADTVALQAYALVHNVPIVGIEKDRKALLTAIKAMNEPTL